jgi:hypothetical protein
MHKYYFKISFLYYYDYAADHQFAPQNSRFVLAHFAYGLMSTGQNICILLSEWFKSERERHFCI